MMASLLNSDPGFTLNSLKITKSLVLSFPTILTLFMVAFSSSLILTSTVIESFTTLVSTALTDENKNPLF